MKRLAWFVLAAGIGVVALFFLVTALVPRDTLKTRIGEQIAGWTGRDVSLRGEPRVSLFPTLSVTLDDVEVGGPPEMRDATIVSMDRLKCTIRLLPLIIGRVEVGSFTMVRPLVHLVLDEKGRRNWEFDSGAAALQLAFAGDVPLGEFHLESGAVVYENRQTGANERLDSVDLAVEWTSVRQPIQVDGSGIWRGEAVKISAGAATPFAFLKGSATPLEAHIDAAPISVSLSGEARGYSQPQITGALKLSTPSLRRFASWLGSQIGPGSTLGQASLTGAAAFKGNALSVDNAKFTLDGNSGSGALKFVASPRPDLAGTLAFGALDLSPYFAGVSAALALAPEWRRLSLPTDWLGDMNADVRLSADSVKIGALSLGDTAASVSLRDRRVEIGLGQAVFDAGSISGDLSVVDRDDAPGGDVAAQLRANDIDLAAAGPLLGLPEGTSGTGSVIVDLTSRGRDLGALVDALGGTAQVHVEGGAVPLFGVGELAAMGDASPASPVADSFTPIPVETVSLALTFTGGVGSVDRANVLASTYAADATGWVRLSDGSLDLNGVVRPGAPTSPAGSPRPFTVEGGLAHPVAELAAPAAAN